ILKETDLSQMQPVESRTESGSFRVTGFHGALEPRLRDKCFGIPLRERASRSRCHSARQDSFRPSLRLDQISGDARRGTRRLRPIAVQDRQRWYAAGLLADGRSMRPPREPVLASTDKHRIRSAIFEHLGEILPGVREI